MAKQSAVNLDITNNPDGFDISGGTISRKLTVTGGDVAISGTGSATITFPTTSTTLAGLSIAQTFSAVQSFVGGFTAAGATFANDIYAPNMVTGVNGITGAVSLTSGSNITITQTGKTITIASVAGSSSPPLATSSVTGVASFRAADFDVSTTGSVSLTANVARTNIAQTFTTVQGFQVGITSAGATFSGNIDLTNNILFNAELETYFEPREAAVLSGDVLVCDMLLGQAFTYTLPKSITGVQVTNVPSKSNTSIGFTLVLTQGTTGGYTAAFGTFVGATARFPGGTAPNMTTTANKTDIVSYITYDNGSNWYGFVGGQAF